VKLTVGFATGLKAWPRGLRPLRCSLDFARNDLYERLTMQNAQNLMSSFEFIAALMSIIIGLGVTNLLAGAGRAFYRRKENPLDEVHIVLTIATLLLLVLQWWVTFKWNTEVTWSFDRFLVLIVWTITLYMLTVFLYPPDLSEAEEHQRRFQRNRVGYYSAFIAMCVLDIAQTAIHGDLFHPIWYVPLCRSLCRPGGRRSRCASPGLRSLLRVVPADHAANRGPAGTEISRSGHDGRVNPPWLQLLIATHSFRARESETACTTRM
jgi:hypothetical protein